MRLINTHSYRLEEFPENATPLYAILSHTWADGEVLFKDLQDGDVARSKRGFEKIRYTCDQAREGPLKLSYAWIDTCCIDKSSSAELQEAINSMYRWYINATVCYAYLADLLVSRPPRPADIEVAKDDSLRHESLKASAWFTRGWTLQELIAPRDIEFYGAGWTFIGRKAELLGILAKITGIQETVLDHTRSISSVSVAKRMSWAANRKTSRIEDRAYSLLGIFDINMPMLYGEGTKSFTRLQEEIIRTIPDQSIFAWSSKSCDCGCLLAESPEDFANDGNVVPWGTPGPYEMTNQGLRILGHFLEAPGQSGQIVVLNCRYEQDFTSTLGLRLRRSSDQDRFPIWIDKHGSSPHSKYSSRRLTLIEVKGLHLATKRSIKLLRRSDPTVQDRTLILRMTCAKDSEPMADIVAMYPRSTWDQMAKTMPLSSKDGYCGGVLLRLSNGLLCFVFVRHVEGSAPGVAAWAPYPPSPSSKPERAVSDDKGPSEETYRWRKETYILQSGTNFIDLSLGKHKLSASLMPECIMDSPALVLDIGVKVAKEHSRGDAVRPQSLTYMSDTKRRTFEKWVSKAVERLLTSQCDESRPKYEGEGATVPRRLFTELPDTFRGCKERVERLLHSSGDGHGDRPQNEVEKAMFDALKTWYLLGDDQR